LVIEVRPLLAAWMVLIAVDIESSRLVKSLARFDRPWAVKKLIGLSSAELTRLPVASLDWVFVMVAAVLCNCRRLARTPAVRTISDIGVPFWSQFPNTGGLRDDPHWIGPCDRTSAVMRRKKI